MNNSMIEAMAGTSSPSKLAPETIRIRNALIEKYADQPIEELNKFLQSALEAEKDELKRLGLLAARVYILRQKVLSLKAFIRDERMDRLPTPNLALTEQILLDETAHSDIDANQESVAHGEWHSLQMIEPGEVNGVRFFEGTIINAKAEDAKKLISSGKAIVIDDEGNPVDNNATDVDDNSDTLDLESDAIKEVKASDATGGGTEPDNENTDNPSASKAANSGDNTDNTGTLDPEDEAIEETEAIDSTGGSTESDNENAGNLGALEATDNDDNTDNTNTLDLDDNAIQETTAMDATGGSAESDNKNVGSPDSEGIKEGAVKESAEKIDTDDSEKTKA